MSSIKRMNKNKKKSKELICYENNLWCRVTMNDESPESKKSFKKVKKEYYSKVNK